MAGKLDELLGFHEAALRVRSQRQQVLASNIANADTPNYHARDIDFKAALQVALNGAQTEKGPVGKNPLAMTEPGHLPERAGKEEGQEMAAGVPLMYRKMMQGSVDNNTVDMDVERNQFMDNALRYEASVSIVSNQIKNLLAVIQG
ncbi:MAG: flagellar basal body rod protein FlgB [Burkholderiaceae bacterium]|jgi:flagellar basal-body rod protein FlgB|nr:flagellar basal body rod protein FlgB [Burkholderiaceae bacterium]